MNYIFHTQEEYNQASIDNVARLAFDESVNIMQGGNDAYHIITLLSELSIIAKRYQLSNTTINTYNIMLSDEHAKNDDIEGWAKND